MDFIFKKLQSNTGEYIEIIDFKPNVEAVEIPIDIEGVPILDISQSALVRNSHIHLFIIHYKELKDDFQMAKFILNNTSQDLRIIFKSDVDEFELTFPSYNDRSIEDTMARAIHFKIDGSGYAYRECVFRDHIDFVGYDEIFNRVKEENSHIPIDIAIGRLFYPYRLSDKSKDLYSEYITNNADDVLDYLINYKDAKRLAFVLDTFELKKESLSKALLKTSTKKLFNLTSIIMGHTLKNG